MTLCLEDDDSGIRDLAHLFFSELSRKTNNPIYNALPDVISRSGRRVCVRSPPSWPC